MSKKKKDLNSVLRVLFIGFIVFCNIPLTIILIVIASLFYSLTHVPLSEQATIIWLLAIFALNSMISAAIIALYFRKMIVRPLSALTMATDKTSKGEFNTRIVVKGPAEFENLGERFNNMAADLGGIEMMRKDFINNFSHEFKTPISSIHGFAKMLKYADLTEAERLEYLDIIISETGRLSNLSVNILNLSKLDNQSILTDKTKYNISEQIRTVIALLEPKWEAKSIEFDFTADEVDIIANYELLNQVWINMIENAIKFSPEKSTITISVKRTMSFVDVAIRDQGRGIDKESKDKIFEKFYQGDTSRFTPGNGLGLAVVKKIIDLHVGSIEIMDVEGNGAAFKILLPHAF